MVRTSRPTTDHGNPKTRSPGRPYLTCKMCRARSLGLVVSLLTSISYPGYTFNRVCRWYRTSPVPLVPESGESLLSDPAGWSVPGSGRLSFPPQFPRLPYLVNSGTPVTVVTPGIRKRSRTEHRQRGPSQRLAGPLRPGRVSPEIRSSFVQTYHVSHPTSPVRPRTGSGEVDRSRVQAGSRRRSP